MTSSDADLSHESILAIERILKVEQAPYADSLDTLSSLFTPIRTLNELFPDGKSCLSGATLSSASPPEQKRLLASSR